jgi:hypothetical protein
MLVKLACAGETYGNKINHNNESGAREIVLHVLREVRDNL